MTTQQLIDDLLLCTNEVDGLLTELPWLICALIPDDDNPAMKALMLDDNQAMEALTSMMECIRKLKDCQEAIDTVFGRQRDILNDARVANDIHCLAGVANGSAADGRGAGA